jgi:hypothetical protein
MEPLQSPFAIPLEDVEVLNASEGFRMLRSYLTRNAEYVAQVPTPPRLLHVQPSLNTNNNNN